MPVVSNSSPLIALEQIRQLDLLQSLFGEILIPGQVAAETVASVQPRSWIRQQSLSLPVIPAVHRPTLGPGEREAICLAIEVKAGAILLDDDPARKLATELGLRVIGTAGVLVLAKERQLISAVRPCLDALIENRFFLARVVHDLILKRVGEM
jgi:predicted nucleic acid-binding protein